MDGGGWVDTHGHLFLLDEDPGVALGRAADAGVSWVLCPGVDVGTSEASAAIAGEHPHRVRWSAGLHPHDASTWPDVADRIAELAARADAVGECGLDWYRGLAPREHQLAAFTDQVALASTLGKPVIVHCRDAFADVHDVLEGAGLGERAVMHCWTGGSRWTRRFAALGVMFSFAGPLTYATADTMRHAARHVPPERALVETDAPYLTPEPLRGQPNEPANVPLTGAALAAVWGIPVDEVARTTSQNAARVFGAPGASGPPPMAGPSRG